MSGEIDAAADALLQRMAANAKNADNTQLLRQIAARLQILAPTPQEAFDQLDEKTKHAVLVSALDRMSLQEVYDFVENDPQQKAFRAQAETEDDKRRVQNAKLVAEVVGAKVT